VGFSTDFIFGDESKVGYSMALVSTIANPIAAYLLWQAFKRARERL
jgi:hypothetical protein